MTSESTSISAKSGSYVQFKTWTGDRALATIGTNSGSLSIPFQAWRTFKEAFAPELIQRAVAETGGATTILDPFGGSGTTALAAQFLGAHPTTCEVNPFLADLIEAKITQYDFDALVSTYAEVRRSVASLEETTSDLGANLPLTFVEPGVKGNFLFWKDVARRLLAYRAAINSIQDETCRRLFRVLLAGLAVSVSNCVVSGKGRRYRRNWQDRRVSPVRVDEAFEAAAIGAIKDIRRFQARMCRDYTLLRGDARTSLKQVGEQDLSIFSPPYPNSFDYTDVYNIELWIGGYLATADDNRTLRAATLRSHVQIHRDMSISSRMPSPLLKESVERLLAVQGKLWNKRIPNMIEAYFDDMSGILKVVREKLRPTGRLYMVVGDSRYANIDVPVANILCELTAELGFHVISAEPFRSMRASPQQGGQSELAETLLVWGVEG